ncbi:MAG: hypothetical protein CL535_00855 [Ahrensia sp.]|nr:hypothetical protein [Ahrensia sp.]
MKRFLIILALIPLLAGCGERYTWRQKLVLEVETPNGVVKGGSVVAMKMHWLAEWQHFASATGVDSDVRGEASFVEVAPGCYLFALINWKSYALGLRTYEDGSRDQKDTAQRLSRLHETRPLPREVWPTLVTFTFTFTFTFTDIADPTTVAEVDPADLAASFGPGYRLKSVTLEITDETVTEGEVEKVLPWMNDGHTLKQLWPSLSHKAHELLSSVRWVSRR